MRFCYPVPELVEGSNLHLLTVVHASGSDLIILLLISVSLFLSFSVFFRVIPWLILLLYSYPCSSVANSSASCLAGPQSN